MLWAVSVAHAQGDILCPAPPLPGHPLPGFSSADGRSFMAPGISAGAAAFMERRSWFGESEFNFGGSADDWAEGYLEPQIKGQFTLPGHQPPPVRPPERDRQRHAWWPGRRGLEPRRPRSERRHARAGLPRGDRRRHVALGAGVGAGAFLGPPGLQGRDGLPVLRRRHRRWPSRRLLDRSAARVRVGRPRHAHPRRRLR